MNAVFILGKPSCPDSGALLISLIWFQELFKLHQFNKQ